MPYELNSSIQFYDGPDTIKFTIVDTFRSESWSFKNNCDCSCEATSYFKSDVNSEIDLRIEGSCTYINDNHIDYQYNFLKYGYSGEYYVVLKSDGFYMGNENGIIKSEIISSFLINNTI